MEAATSFPSAPPTAERLLAEIADLKARLATESTRGERLQGELDLRNSALDAAPSHFVISDTRKPRTPTVYVNRAVARACGYEPAEMLGMVFTDFFPRELNEVEFQRVMEELRNGREVSSELLARRKDGSTFWAGIRLTFLRDTCGRITHIVGVGADITTRLEQERARRDFRISCTARCRSASAWRSSCAWPRSSSLSDVLRRVSRTRSTHRSNTSETAYSSFSPHTWDLDRLLATYRAALQQMAGPGIYAIRAGRAVRRWRMRSTLQFVTVEIPKAFERTLQGVERVRAIVHAMKEFAHPDGNRHSSADLNHAIETTLHGRA